MIDAFWLRATWHSLRRRFRRSAITFAGVAFSVAALVVLYAVMTGVGDAMVRNSVSLDSGHVMVTAGDAKGDWPAALARLPGVRRVLPRHILSGVLRSASGERSVTLCGVDPEQERRETVIARRVVAGTYLASPGDVLLGRGVADALGVAVGDTVTLWQADGGARTWRVGGVFATTVPWLDDGTAYVRAADLSPDTRATITAAVFLDNGTSLERALSDIRAAVPASARVVSWRERMPEVVQLVSLNHVSMAIVLALVLLILAFGISNTVAVSVADRTREFAVLKTLGVTPSGVSLMVVAETLMLVLSAGLLGLGLGVAATYVLATTGIDLSAWTSSNRHFIASGVITPRATAGGLLLPYGVTALCGLLASLLPARRAGAIRVAQALRAL